MSGERVEFVKCQRSLATLWFVTSAVLVVLFAAQSFAGQFRTETAAAWSWLMPNFVPTLSLMIGVLIRDQRLSDVEGLQVDRFVFQLAFWVSVFYLGVLLFSILAWPLTNMRNAIGALQLSNAWLVPLQGLSAATIGAFFIEQRSKGD